MPNPYAVSADLADADGDVRKRSFLCTAVATVQLVACAAYVAVGIFLAVLIPFVGFGTARTDERALALAVILSAPFAAWVFVLEMMNWRETAARRELLLARFGVLLTLVPFVMAAFWFYEFTLAGSIQLNGVPAILSVLFGLVWLPLARVRLKRAAEHVRDEAERAGCRSSLALGETERFGFDHRTLN